MNKLNVFYILTQRCNKFKYFFRGFKYAYQRATRGYCDMDTWDLDIYYLNLFKNSLSAFTDLTNGWNDTKYETFDEYVTDIKSQIDKIDYVLSDVYEENEYWEEYSEILKTTQRTKPSEYSDAAVQVYWDMNEEQKLIQEKFRNRDDEIKLKHEIVRNEVFDWLKENIQELWW